MKAFIALLVCFSALAVVAEPPSYFFPFGESYDEATERDDEYNSEAIDFPFKFYDQDETELIVNNNGFLTFREGIVFDAYVPALPTTTLPTIAPYWADVDNEVETDAGNSVFYRVVDVDADSTTVLQAQNFIRAAFDMPAFEVKSMFVATWDRVTHYRGGEEGGEGEGGEGEGEGEGEGGEELTVNTFQVALVTGALSESIIIFNYADIEWTHGTGGIDHAHVGFASGDGSYEILTESGTADIIDVNKGSNLEVEGVALTGQYAWVVSKAVVPPTVIKTPAHNTYVTSSFKVTGVAQPNTEVKVYLDSTLYDTVTADEEGKFVVSKGEKLSLESHTVYAETEHGTSDEHAFKARETVKWQLEAPGFDPTF